MPGHNHLSVSQIHFIKALKDSFHLDAVTLQHFYLGLSDS